MNLLSLTAVELGKKIKAHEVTVEEATRAALDAIRAKEKDINSFVTVDEESAMIRAKEVQKMIDDGTLTGPLAGVPQEENAIIKHLSSILVLELISLAITGTN